MLNRKIKTSFSRVSADYDKYRLSYPEELIDYIISMSGITPDSKILEIGGGSGIASELFARKGFSLTIVEPLSDPLSLAKQKLSKYENTQYISRDFEKIELPKESYDLIFAAQAFHWVNPSVGFQKVYELLKKDGFFAVFWNLAQREKSELLQDTRRLYKSLCPDYHMGEVRIIVDDLIQSNLFRNKEKRSFEREVEFSREHYAKMIQTYSWVASLTDDKKELFQEELKNVLSRYDEPLKVPYDTLLGIAQK